MPRYTDKELEAIERQQAKESLRFARQQCKAYGLPFYITRRKREGGYSPHTLVFRNGGWKSTPKFMLILWKAFVGDKKW